MEGGRQRGGGWERMVGRRESERQRLGMMDEQYFEM
jgi:hypothetical protein